MQLSFFEHSKGRSTKLNVSCVLHFDRSRSSLFLLKYVLLFCLVGCPIWYWLVSDLVKKGVLQCFMCWYSLCVVKFEHLIEQIESAIIVHLAYFCPRYLLFLHLVRNQAAVTILECDFLDSIRAKQAHKGYEVRYSEVLDLAAIVEREDWMALSEEA